MSLAAASLTFSLILGSRKISCAARIACLACGVLSISFLAFYLTCVGFELRDALAGGLEFLFERRDLRVPLRRSFRVPEDFRVVIHENLHRLYPHGCILVLSLRNVPRRAERHFCVLTNFGHIVSFLIQLASSKCATTERLLLSRANNSFLIFHAS